VNILMLFTVISVYIVAQMKVWCYSIKGDPMLKRETYLNSIRPFYNSDLIKVLVGIRRSGKSIILQQIQEELLEMGVKEDRIIAINFELLDFSFVKDELELFNYVLSKIMDGEKNYVFLDEVQVVPNFEKAVNSLRTNRNCSVFITGSNSQLLSSELATLLSGRYVQFNIYPFTYKEVCAIKQERGELITNATFSDFMKWGGFPQRFEFERESSIQTYLLDVYNSIVFKDIIQRHNVRDIDLFSRVIEYVIENTGQLFTANTIVSFLKNENRKVRVETVYNYLRYLLDSMIIRKAERYDIRGKKVLALYEKYYVADLGLRQIIKNTINTDFGKILENIVFNELLYRGYHIYIGKTNQGEVDFIAIRNNKKCYIQVTYLLSEPKTVEREFGAFKDIDDNFPKYVISTDQFDMSRDGIQHLNLIDFLLNETILD